MVRLHLIVLLLLLSPPLWAGNATAVFAGGCFWCLEADLEKLPGVTSAESGYTGGRLPSPSYEQVSAGGTGHYEAVRVRYDPERIDYPALLNAFWRNVDPLDDGGQFCDRGPQYRAAIFVHDEVERRLAESSRDAVAQRLGRPVVTPILAARPFWRAEPYHQDYAKKNPLRYQFYRSRCGRDHRLQQLWSGPRP